MRRALTDPAGLAAALAAQFQAAADSLRSTPTPEIAAFILRAHATAVGLSPDDSADATTERLARLVSYCRAAAEALTAARARSGVWFLPGAEHGEPVSLEVALARTAADLYASDVPQHADRVHAALTEIEAVVVALASNTGGRSRKVNDQSVAARVQQLGRALGRTITYSAIVRHEQRKPRDR